MQHPTIPGLKIFTNGENSEIHDKAEFLVWMHKESTPVPQSREEMDAIMRSWIAHRRREGIWA